MLYAGNNIKASIGIRDREACENDLLTFLRAAWRYIDPSPFVLGWHLEAIAEHLQAVTDGYIQRLVINVPPRASKSSLCSVAWPAWTWAQPERGPLAGPQVQFLSSSYAHTLSLRDSVKTRRLIQSAWYQKHWGSRFALTGDVNTKGRFENDKGGYRLATSVDGTTTGEGGDCFSSGTFVSTPAGAIEIEKIKPGQSVLSFDTQRGKVVEGRVVATKSRYLGGLHEFHTAKGHRFSCTGNHPIYSPGRGYIRAGEMGVGDRLLGEKVRSKRLDYPFQFPLHNLWQADSEAAVRGPEGVESGQSGLLLLQWLSGSPFFYKTLKTLCDLRWPKKQAPFVLLLQRVLGGREKKQKKNNVLSLLWGDVLRVWKDLLQFGMCGFGAFQADAGQSQLQVQGAGKVFQSIQGDGGVYTSKGWPQMRFLWPSGQVGEDRKGSVGKKVNSCGSPYRREHKEQCSREPDPAVSLLPQEAPSWEFDYIASITTHGEREYCVHDIQVGRWCNFFAEGILAHNCLIIDDANLATEAESDVVRESTNLWWDEAMSTRLNNQDTGAYVVIMQRLHQEDLTGHILSREAKDWVHLMLPMEHDVSRHCITYINGEKFWEDPRTEEGELLCPERFSAPTVELLRRRLGPYAAAAQLDQLPAPRGGGLILDEWWRHWTQAKYPQCEFVVASLDTAYTEKSENDASCLSIWGVFRDSESNVIPLEIAKQGSESIQRWYSNQYAKAILLYQWQERLNFPDLVKKVMESCTINPMPGITTKQRFKVDKLVIENKAAGISVAQELHRQLGFSGKFGVDLFDPRKYGDKVARVIAVQHMFADGIVYVPWPADENGVESPNGYKWVEEAMDQMGVFPRGSSDDFVDSTSMALRWLRDSGILLRPEEYADDVASELAYKPNLPALYPA